MTLWVIIFAGAAMGVGMAIGYNLRKWEAGKEKKKEQ